MSAEYKDQTRVCGDCGRDYVWSTSEQVYFHEKGFAEPPKRCKDCRRAKKEQRDEQQRGGLR